MKVERKEGKDVKDIRTDKRRKGKQRHQTKRKTNCRKRDKHGKKSAKVNIDSETKECGGPEGAKGY